MVIKVCKDLITWARNNIWDLVKIPVKSRTLLWTTLNSIFTIPKSWNPPPSYGHLKSAPNSGEIGVPSMRCCLPRVVFKCGTFDSALFYKSHIFSHYLWFTAFSRIIWRFPHIIAYFRGYYTVLKLFVSNSGLYLFRLKC